MSLGAAAPWFGLVREVADFPAPGIRFKDLMPLLAHRQAFADLIADLAAGWRAARLDAVVGIESRGFIVGAPLAHALGVGFVPLRKPGKLPGPTLGIDYQLEYGSDRLELQADALGAGSRVGLVDDVLATGGTLDAARQLLQRAGLELVGAAVVIELQALQARSRWPAEVPLRAVLPIM